MADPQLATKAPESDMIEESLDTPITPSAPKLPVTTAATTSTTDTAPQAQLSDHCTTDRPILAGQQPTGEVSKYNNIDTYISKPADYPSTPAKLLLLLTNGRGVHSPNNQLQADTYAQKGFVVVMPDMFGGDPAPDTATAQYDSADPDASWLDTIKARVVETSKSFMIDMWLARHTAEKVMPILLAVLDSVREEFADAVAHGGGVYAVGYCFGGKYVLMLAGQRSDTVMQGQDGREEDVEAGMIRRGPEIKCGAVAHATLVTREDLQQIKVPISLVCVGEWASDAGEVAWVTNENTENDPLFPEDVLNYGRKELGAGQVKHEIKVYPGVPHGFAVFGEYELTTIRDAQKEASNQLLSWLQKH